MISYRDMTFCSSEECINEQCYRFLSNSTEQDAKDFGLPIAFSDFSLDCDLYDDGEEDV